MNEGQRLLQAILRDPSDTALRLVYADWLEEQGEGKRAEAARDWRERYVFGHLPGSSGWIFKEGPALDADLVAAFFRDCCATGLAPHCESSLAFRRGLIEGVRCSVTDWLAHGKGICARHPVLSLELRDFAPGHSPGHGYAPDSWYVHVLRPGEKNSWGPRRPFSEFVHGCWGRRLRAGKRMFGRRAMLDRKYPCAASALADVQQAALAWARERRGRKGFPGRAA